jgi:hypothetical protein
MTADLWGFLMSRLVGVPKKTRAGALANRQEAV